MLLDFKPIEQRIVDRDLSINASIIGVFELEQ